MGRIQRYIFLLFFPCSCFSFTFPDLGGVLDFHQPEAISDTVFILTNPKSGTHLLVYSLIKMTKRPARLRFSYALYQSEPACFLPDNIMHLPLDYSKPTMYWGHEYKFLRNLNHKNNKLLFVLRNYKENLLSQLKIRYGFRDTLDFDRLLLEEVQNEKQIFQGYLSRLRVFDTWNPAARHVVLFSDLLFHPEIFAPQVLAFLEEEGSCDELISGYENFKKQLRLDYDRERKRATGAMCDLRFFSKKVSEKTLKQVDAHVQKTYPYLWNNYLKIFAEKE